MGEKTKQEIRSKIYTSYSDLKKELVARQNNKELQKKVKDFFGENMFSLVAEKPHFILSRSIATPNQELRYYLDLVKEFDYNALVLEYDNKFVAKNKDSYHLCRLFFYRLLNNHHAISVDTKQIVNFNEEEGKKFSEITTTWGQGIQEFHHELLRAEIPSMNCNVYNFTKWFDSTKNLSEHYYLYYLALFVCNGVLFENFLLGDKQETSFIDQKFLPSFDKVEEIFGVKPLIYPLLPFENEKNDFWLSYPETMIQSVDDIVRSKM